ncbi:uroporphyrinogen-III synthase [Shewanella sp. cp20]|uniref:uroporphyrinogen-III synthase n=1 Tax=Shewanella sp. cp20 TaxID=1521167 RepID=UPI0005A2BA39|nr:uroporphyrinogen-III synthase [Shewanella sp. cp20]KIO35911.1 uroporphyrinogen III synthase [Shewanella sp. cp20]
MKLLLTRPEGRNQSMAEALSQRGVPFTIAPLLQVVANDAADHEHKKKLFHQSDIIIFISTNAVEYADIALTSDWPKDKQYFAVGQATYAALQAKGITATEAPESCQQTEGLLTLPSLQALTAKRITIVRGVGGREVLASALAERGAQVDYWEVYRRACPEFDPSTAFEWQAQAIDTIVITSGEILANLITLVPKELFAWLHACHIIVPSERVYDQAIAAGFTRVTNAKAANRDAVLTALGLQD